MPEDLSNNTIAEFVTNWRVKHRVSCAELGQSMGVTRQYVYIVGKGHHLPAINFAALFLGQCTKPEREELSWLMHEAACEAMSRHQDVKDSSRQQRLSL